MSDFDEIWCAEENSGKENNHFMKIQRFPNSRRRTCCYFQNSVVAISQHQIILLWSNFV